MSNRFSLGARLQPSIPRAKRRDRGRALGIDRSARAKQKYAAMR
jgi:hypothetical protein